MVLRCHLMVRLSEIQWGCCRYVYPAAHQVDAATEHERLKKVTALLESAGLQHLHDNCMRPLCSCAACDLSTRLRCSCTVVCAMLGVGQALLAHSQQHSAVA